MAWTDVGKELEQLDMLVPAGEAEFILTVKHLCALSVHALACTEETESKSRGTSGTTVEAPV